MYLPLRDMDHAALHERARSKGVQPIVYWIVRAVLQPFFHLYFRLSRIGLEHVPQDGPYIVAANHRSFLDPFIIAVIARRPLYYVAKRELFERRWQGWLLNALGAFPVDRGTGDQDMLETARAILARGDSVLIFPEGTRIRPGALGRPRARRRPPGAGDGRPRRPRRDHRHGVHPPRLAHPPAQGPRARGPPPHLPARGGPLAGARRRRHRPHLALRDAAVGVAGRAAAAAPCHRARRRPPGRRRRRSRARASSSVRSSPAPTTPSSSAGALPIADAGRPSRVVHITGDSPLCIRSADRGLGRQVRDALTAGGREATVERVAA